MQNHNARDSLMCLQLQCQSEYDEQHFLSLEHQKASKKHGTIIGKRHYSYKSNTEVINYNTQLQATELEPSNK